MVIYLTVAHIVTADYVQHNLDTESGEIWIKPTHYNNNA